MNLSRIGGRSILNAAFCIKKGEKTAFIRVLNKVGRKKKCGPWCTQEGKGKNFSFLFGVNLQSPQASPLYRSTAFWSQAASPRQVMYTVLFPFEKVRHCSLTEDGKMVMLTASTGGACQWLRVIQTRKSPFLGPTVPLLLVVHYSLFLWKYSPREKKPSLQKLA